MAELATWVGSLPGVATCWNTLVSTVQWVNALPPVLGALVGGVVMLAVLYVAIRLWIFTKFMYTIEQLPGPLALPWLGNSLQLMSLMNRPKAWYMPPGCCDFLLCDVAACGKRQCLMFHFPAADRMHTHDENARAEAEKFRETLPFIDWARDFQPLFRLWVGPIPAVIITDPSVARLVLGPSGPLTKSSIYKFIHPWLKTGLLTSGGNKWKARRKLCVHPGLLLLSWAGQLLTHVLSRAGLLQAFTLMSSTITSRFLLRSQTPYVTASRPAARCLRMAVSMCVRALVRLRMVVVVVNHTGTASDTYVTNATLAIISKCAFGSQVAAQALPGEPQSEYVRAVNCQTESLFKRVLQPW